MSKCLEPMIRINVKKKHKSTDMFDGELTKTSHLQPPSADWIWGAKPVFVFRTHNRYERSMAGAVERGEWTYFTFLCMRLEPSKGAAVKQHKSPSFTETLNAWCAGRFEVKVPCNDRVTKELLDREGYRLV